MNAILDELQPQSVRLGFEWQYMEPVSSASFDTNYQNWFDTWLPELALRNVKVMALVMGSPGWANGGQGRDSRNFTNADFLAYMTRVFNRWGTHFEAIQIWNEPGLVQFMEGTLVQRADRYASLLIAAYPHCKAYKPSMTVLGCSLYQPVWDNQTFLNYLYDRGIKDYFDVMDQHMYSDAGVAGQLGGGVSHPIPYASMYQAVVNNTIATMNARGDTTKDLWITETGLSTAAAADCATEAQQAAGLTACYAALTSGSYPRIKRCYWYRVIDESTFSNTERENRWGIGFQNSFATMGTRKDAWDNFAAVA